MNVVHITPSFIDKRGTIHQILEFNGTNIKTALYISSKAGSIRANHYHKKDSHYTYLLSGKFEYCEKKVTVDSKKIEQKIILPGDLVITKPMVIHAMKFIEDSTMVVFTTEPRDQTSYERDTVRVQLD